MPSSEKYYYTNDMNKTVDKVDSDDKVNEDKEDYDDRYAKRKKRRSGNIRSTKSAPTTTEMCDPCLQEIKKIQSEPKDKWVNFAYCNLHDFAEFPISISRFKACIKNLLS